MTHNNKFLLEEVCMRPEMKIRFAMKKYYICITIHCGVVWIIDEMLNTIGGCQSKFDQCEQTAVRFREKHVEGNNAGIYWKKFTLNHHNNWWIFQIFKQSTN